MKSALLWSLLALNVALGVAVVNKYVTPAYAQVGRPSDYLMVPAQVNGISTGVVFIVANPGQYVGPPLSLSFVAKMFFILLACLNAFLYYVSGLKRAADGVEAGEEAPSGAKVSAAVSLFLWVAVMYWGRVLQFFGKSF